MPKLHDNKNKYLCVNSVETLTVVTHATILVCKDNTYRSLTIIQLESTVISFCHHAAYIDPGQSAHPCSLTKLYTVGWPSSRNIPKMIMDSSKNGRWVILLKQFKRLWIKYCEVRVSLYQIMHGLIHHTEQIPEKRQIYQNLSCLFGRFVVFIFEPLIFFIHTDVFVFSQIY